MILSPKPPHPEALFRHNVLSQVIHRELAGQSRPDAVNAVAAEPMPDLKGQSRLISVRTLYRWLAAFECGGFEALIPTARIGQGCSLPEDLLAFFQQEKEADLQASVPELIRRAHVLGHLAPGQKIDRTTLWRQLKRMGLDTQRIKHPKQRDCRRFSFPHRMDMVLCDGKHFRAGPNRHKRVALFFLDDASRYALAVVVGPSESAALFLRGWYLCLLSHGRMIRLFVDRGTGFTALDTLEVARKLDIHLIHGTAGYPQGRGKVERFNRTVAEQELRFLASAGVDSNFPALELRLRHYLERYNHTPHEALNGATPWQRFSGDTHPLRFHASHDQLKQAFLLHEKRQVSTDHVVSVAGVTYETPTGYAGREVLPAGL